MKIKGHHFKKRWIIMSASLLFLLSSGLVATHSVSANKINQNNNVKTTRIARNNSKLNQNNNVRIQKQPRIFRSNQNYNATRKSLVPKVEVASRHYGRKSKSYNHPRYHYRKYRRYYRRRARHIRRHYYRRHYRKAKKRYRRRMGGRNKYVVGSYYNGASYISNRQMNAIKHYRDSNQILNDGDGFDNSDDFGSKAYDPIVHIIRSTKLGNLRFYQVNSNHSELRKAWILAKNLSNYRKYSKNDSSTLISNDLNDYYAHHYLDHNLYNYYETIKDVHDYLLKHKDNSKANLSTYRQDVQVWVNYYKYCLYHETPVSLYNPYNDYAQQHDEAGQDPEDWAGSDIPSVAVDGYFNDYGDIDHDGTPGHRNSLLNPSAIRLGVGRAHGNNTLFFDWGLDNNASFGKPIVVPYPNAGIFPYYDATNCEYWSFEFAENPYAQNGTPDVPDVSVKDDTTGKYVRVSDVHTRPGAVYYNVNYNALRLYHSYTITLTGDSIPHGGSVTYTTCLVNL